jgi:signal transduction histidine kinase
VDSAQIASALANILTNAGQSYEASEGRIEIAVTALPTGDVSLRVRDWGRGMDEETRKRALHPFFSALPAGRKRGMGLAYAHRLATINGGHLSIQSQLDTGTTATLRLPRAEV